MKKSLLIIDIILVIILVFVLGWYLFGEYGPLEGELTTKQTEEMTDTSADVETEDTKIQEETEEESEQEETPVVSTTSLVFTGDVELSQYVQANYDASGVNGVVDEEILSLLNDATFTMINNEFCFSERGTAADKQYTFRVNPSYVSLLTDLGVDIAGLANNHVLDFGKDALLDTFTTLEGAGIEYTGAGNSLDEAAKLVIKTDEAGRTYGFLAASHVIPEGSWNVLNSTPGEFTFYDETELINRIKEASTQVDYLFVMVHWGVERTIELEDYQRTDAHDFIDAGATAVIGMHSHCLQPVEIYEGKPIFYSLGNFIFNTSIQSGGAVEFFVDENNEMTTRIIPIVAEGAKTRAAVESDTDYYDYIEGISENILIDDEGYISGK